MAREIKRLKKIYSSLQDHIRRKKKSNKDAAMIEKKYSAYTLENVLMHEQNRIT